ncbi:hypothetical protein QR680_009481 [Steinernema hermaphroditum]|uniref:CTLH domain-containing protein n=1 Tax=Steinernema hermaphroditum TaxID=289476 RepID=A0AA39M8X7_9BILA|nr:hypothetical protein QR680_009481 [Steinernema hermaphroditum]
MPSSVALSVSEKDVLKTILEFLENRGLHIAQLALERETGVINGEFTDDALFLRQLILDGQWDNALDFVQPLGDVADVDLRAFRYQITKFKYLELLCIKQEPGPLHDNDFTVEELVECLKDLEHICPSPEDFRHLCALLTLPKLSDHAEFRYWNPSSARVECFKKVYPMVGPILTSISAQRRGDGAVPHATNDRLLQLLCKGTFYESCVDFCQAQALGDKKAIEEGPQLPRVLATRPKIASSDLSLVSWVEVLGKETFVAPFQQKNLDFRMISLRKPKLDAQWTEQILATPIKPGGMFPHALVPRAKLKSAEKMSQSHGLFPMSSSYAMGTSFSLGLTPRVRPHAMSQSTAPGFLIQETAIAEMAMQQSQMIDALLETSELTKSSRPGGAHQQLPSGPHAFSQSFFEPPTTLPGFDASSNRRQLDEMARRSQPRQTSLSPVPELPTPSGGASSSGGEDSASLQNMTRSRLFQEFATRQNIRQPGAIPSEFVTPAQPPVALRSDFEAPAADYAPRKPLQPLFQNPPMSLGASLSASCLPTAPNPQSGVDAIRRPLSQPPAPSRGISVQFEAISRYEDQQAIRAVAFHPSGRFFAIGTNSKQLLVCRYPDVRKLPRRSGVPATPEVVLSRPKQHRGSVYCLGFNPTGELLATGSNDKSLRLMAFNAEHCRIGAEMELNMHDGTVRDVVFMEDVLVSGGAGNCGICVTDCASGHTVRTLSGHSAPILGLYTWGGSYFVSCSQDKTIRLWDLRVPSAVGIVSPGQRTSSAPVTSVCVDPSGKLLVSGHEDASVVLYDVTGGRVVQQYRPHGDEVRTVRFSNAAYYLLSGSYDKRVVITDMRGDLTAPLMYLPVAEHNDKIIQCRWHPHDFTFLSTSADRSAVLWSLPTAPSYP